MARGLSLHIGLNAVSPTHYQGWDGQLVACEADANDMESVAKSRGFKTTKLLTAKATRTAILRAISRAAAQLKAGDIFFLTYSGHGGQLPDLNSDESDGQDETWCAYNGQIVDDELYNAYGKFAAGVRIVILSDSCHSGTVAKNALAATVLSTQPPVANRAMPLQVVQRTYLAHKAFYDKILKQPNMREQKDAVKASVLLISGCQDNQVSQDGAFNGLFTGTLLHVWNGGKFNGSYAKLHKAILGQMPPTQSPNFFHAGVSDPAFDAQPPFVI